MHSRTRLRRADRRAEAEWQGPSTLVASGLGDDTGGGVYVLRQGRCETVDHLSTTGMAASRDGTRLARLVWTDDRLDTPGELLVYDREGLLTYRRVDDLHEPHSAHWDTGALAVVSTRTNTILWLDHGGETTRRWTAPGEGDCWHLNSLCMRRGRLVASAFGRFEEHRGWADSGQREGRGIVFDVKSGRDLLTGLSAPHNPVWLGDGWLICNSGKGELLRLDVEGEVLDRRVFPGWTRGLACDDSLLYVGVSAHRLRGAEAARAFVVAVTRDGFDEVERWSLPCREVYDVSLVPDPLVAGLRTGIRANPLRRAEQQTLAMLDGLSADVATVDE